MTRAAYLLTAYDAVSTAVALTLLGGYEVNPVMASAMASWGVTGALLARLAIGTAVVGWLDWAADRPTNRWGTRPLALTVAALAAVAVWNTGALAVAVTW